MMIDKLVFIPERVLNEEENPRTITRKLRLGEIVDVQNYESLRETSVNGTERNKFRFFVIQSCEGIQFKCHKASRETPAWEHAIETIELNPNHRCFGGNLHIFIHRAEALLNPTVCEHWRLIRIDYALNVPFALHVVVKGLSFEKRAVHRMMFKPKQVEELMIGSRHSTTLAAYDYNERHGSPASSSPLTRLEIRLFDKNIPASLRQLRDLGSLVMHARSIATGTYNPFRDVVLRVGFAFPDVERPVMPASGRVTPAYQREWMDFALEMNAQSAVNALLSATAYARAKQIALQTGSGLRSAWLGMTERRFDLNSHLRQAAEEFVRERPRPRIRPRPTPRPLQLAA